MVVAEQPNKLQPKPLVRNDVDVNQTYNVLDGKKKMETIWQIILILITVLTAFLARNIYLYNTLDEFKGLRAANPSDLLYGFIFSFLYYYLEKGFHFILDDYMLNNFLRPDKYIKTEQRVRRAYTLTKFVWSICYYGLSSFAAVMLLKDTPSWPTYLGGSGKCINAMLLPLRDPSFGMRLFYVVSFGKHFCRLFVHLFIRRDGNLYEYALHHGLSTYLIAFSFLTDQWHIGIIILFLHDLSDAFLAETRLYADYKERTKFKVQLSYVGTVLSWVGCRLVIFQTCCVFPAWEALSLAHTRYTPFEAELLAFPNYFMLGMLVCLSFLQVFWTYFIINSALSTSSTKYTHNYD